MESTVSDARGLASNPVLSRSLEDSLSDDRSLEDSLSDGNLVSGVFLSVFRCFVVVVEAVEWLDE